ncbi:DUF3667 domain-containing protein [Leeuwenhoekiella sp. UBA1003]|uniref:DUF3667 domain-containing protein n=1 Tax=Leeuwenhoekiella sp. UBA1003 TaxID=1946744 RepID=UPI0025B9B910|nr:DUF3667 domain-containing protein [Leeuwenhoekiella sp. UBA1003]
MTIKNLLEDLNDRFLNIDAGLPKTFIALFTKPEDVIGGYIEGVRKKYLSAFGYFALSLTVAGIYVFILREYFLDTFLGNFELAEGQSEVELSVIKDFTIKINEYQALLSILSIPLLALISRIVFWNYKKYNYLEHIVIYLYAFSHINLVFYILLVLTMWSPDLYTYFSFISVIGYLFYICYVLKRLYQLNTASLILKTLLFGVLGSVFFVIISIVTALVMLKLGMFDEVLENAKAMQAAKP